MIISKDIKIGLNVLSLCDFYYKLQMYVDQYIHVYGYDYDCLLFRLNVYEKDNLIMEEYFFERNHRIYVIVHNTNIDNKNDSWTSESEISDKYINTGFDYTLDLNYFYKNN